MIQLSNRLLMKYLEDTIWCNDRSIYDKGSWDKDNINESLLFGTYDNVMLSHTPSLDCPNVNDSFTVSEVNGNGDLTYPVALLTMNEIVMAGENNGYLGDAFWSMTPSSMRAYYGFYSSLIFANGIQSKNSITESENSVRPAISLREGISVSSGLGTSDDPYIIF